MVKPLLYLPLLLLMYMTPSITFGQCIDEYQIRNGFNCPTNYEPVCGCDGYTYRNLCHAEYYAGNTAFHSGVCRGVDMVMQPNPLSQIAEVHIAVSEPQTVTVFVHDLYGVQYRQVNWHIKDKHMEHMDFRNLKNGFYLLTIIGKDDFKVLKFVKREF